MKKKKKKSAEEKLFDRAYDKAARLQPGQESTLTEEEEQILLEAIRAYEARKQAAFDDFWALLQEQGVPISYHQAKLLFRDYWREEKFK